MIHQELNITQNLDDSYLENCISNKKPLMHDGSVYEKINIKDSKLFFVKSKNTRHNIFGLWSLDLIDKLFPYI